jgi:hypothetical protein
MATLNADITNKFDTLAARLARLQVENDHQHVDAGKLGGDHAQQQSLAAVTELAALKTAVEAFVAPLS